MKKSLLIKLTEEQRDIFVDILKQYDADCRGEVYNSLYRDKFLAGIDALQKDCKPEILDRFQEECENLIYARNIQDITDCFKEIIKEY